MARKTKHDDEMRSYYDFSGGERGKHAARYADGTNVVVMAPDIASVFPDSIAVNYDSRMSEDDAKPQLLQAIEAEIALINERHRLEGITSWAVAAGIIWLLGTLATAWEAGGIRWHNVATLVVALLLASDVTATVLSDSSAVRVVDPPFRLWMYPNIAAFTLQLALLGVAYYLRHDVPSWFSVLAMVIFGGGAVLFASLQPGLAKLMSKTTAVKNTWDRRSQRPHDAGVRGTLFIGKRVRPVIYTVLALAYGRAAYSVHPGESLRDLRLAVTIVLIVALLGIAMRERIAPVLVELSDLRRNLTLDRISASDATDAFLAIVLGIRGAPYVIAKCREAIQAMRELHLEAENLLQAISGQGRADQARRDMSLLRQRITLLDSKVRQVWSVTKAQQSMYEVLRPQGAQLLTNIIGEVEDEIESLNSFGHAIVEALEGEVDVPNPT